MTPAYHARGDDALTQIDSAARDAVRYTVSLYNSAVDRAAYHELVNVFAPEAEMIISDDIRISGRQAIVDGLSAGAKRRGAFEPGNFQRHNLGNSIINITGDIARSVHYIMVLTELGFDHAGVYIDRFEKRDDYWWIVERRANMEWARPDSRFYTFPGTTYVSTPAQLDIGLFTDAR
jgi:hypothetical protein